MFTMKRWVVGVVGFPDVHYVAHSQSAARMAAFYGYTSAYSDCTFKQFLSKCAFVRRDRSPAPETFGRPITVQGKPAFEIDQCGNQVRFVYPDETRIFSSHELDVKETQHV